MIEAGSGQQTDVPRRRHAVVVHADIVEYSRLLADDAAATVAAVEASRRLVTDVTGAAGGVLINFVGDSFMAAFEDARTAIAAALDICRVVRERNTERPRARRLWFRFGLDAGEIMTAADGRWFGDALNIAARVQALAETGGINVTEAVYRALDEPALRFVGLGSKRLKNIPERVRVFRLAGVAPDADAPAPSTRSVPVVAVPLPAHADDPVSWDIATALRLDIVAALGGIPGLRVVEGPPSGMGGPVAAEVTYVLESGAVRSGRGVRVYASLQELETMNRVWGDRWQGSTDDLFALQDTVSGAVVRAMEIELVVGAPAQFYRSGLDTAERASVYEGWHELYRGTPASWARAVELFEAVVRGRPDAVTGRAVSAFARWWGALEGFSTDPTGDLAAAADHARRGIELDDPSGLSQLVMAALRLHRGEDLDRALVDAEVSLARRPTCDVSYAVFGSLQRYLGDWRAAVDACERAQDLSPVGRPWFATVLASAYHVGERYHDAAQTAEWVLDRQPDNREALLVLAASQQALGLARRAKATVAVLRDRYPELGRDAIARDHPFRDREIVQRWTAQLAAAGLP